MAGIVFTAMQFVAKEDVKSGWLPLALVSYGASLAASLWVVVLPRRFEELKPRSFLTGLWLYPKDRAAAELANSRLGQFELNVVRQGRLVRLVRFAFGLALLGAIASTAHLALGSQHHG